jgi:hypothetical protein
MIFFQLRNLLFFKPDDPFNLYQVPAQRSIEGATEVERIKGIRYPSPGSQPPPSVPLRDNSDDIYDINYYAKDPRNIRIGVNLLPFLFLFRFHTSRMFYFRMKLPLMVQSLYKLIMIMQLFLFQEKENLVIWIMILLSFEQLKQQIGLQLSEVLQQELRLIIYQNLGGKDKKMKFKKKE